MSRLGTVAQPGHPSGLRNTSPYTRTERGEILVNKEVANVTQAFTKVLLFRVLSNSEHFIDLFRISQ